MILSKTQKRVLSIRGGKTLLLPIFTFHLEFKKLDLQEKKLLMKIVYIMREKHLQRISQSGDIELQLTQYLQQ